MATTLLDKELHRAGRRAGRIEVEDGDTPARRAWRALSRSRGAPLPIETYVELREDAGTSSYLRIIIARIAAHHIRILDAWGRTDDAQRIAAAVWDDDMPLSAPPRTPRGLARLRAQQS